MTIADHEPHVEPEEEHGHEETAAVKQQRTRTPLSTRTKWQLLAVYMIQFAEPITAFVIYPFAPEFVRRTGVTEGDEKRTGYYAGIIESMFFVTEALSVVWWARMSDHTGRRPVVLLGPLGLAVAMVLFGLSEKYASLVLFRAIQGVFNGNIGLCKTIMAELTDASNRAEVFSITSFTWASGLMIANTMGGMLANPADKWPDSFGKIALLRKHPYFLPCAVAACVALVSFLFAFIRLEETSAAKRPKPKPYDADAPDAATGLLEHGAEAPPQDYGAASTAPSSESSTLTEPSHEYHTPTLRDLFKPRYTVTLAAYATFSFFDASYVALIPLFYSTSLRHGGLGFAPYQIGAILGAGSLVSMVYQLFVSAVVIRWLGPRRTLAVAIGLLMVTFGAFVVITVLVRAQGRVSGATWAVLVLQRAVTVPMSSGWAAIAMLMIDSAPTPAYLALTNSVAQMTVCVFRSVGPSVASSLFSASLEHNLLGGCFVFVLFFCLQFGSLRVVSMIPKQMQHAQ